MFDESEKFLEYENQERERLEEERGEAYLIDKIVQEDEKLQRFCKSVDKICKEIDDQCAEGEREVRFMQDKYTPEDVIGGIK